MYVCVLRRGDFLGAIWLKLSELLQDWWLVVAAFFSTLRSAVVSRPGSELWGRERFQLMLRWSKY